MQPIIELLVGEQTIENSLESQLILAKKDEILSFFQGNRYIGYINLEGSILINYPKNNPLRIEKSNLNDIDYLLRNL